MLPLPSRHRATTNMISTIHVLKGRAGLDDDTYRDMLEQKAGVRSAKDLSSVQAGRIIDHLRSLAGEPGARGAVAGLDGPIGRKLRALWISGYNLGIIRDRTDKAMLSFLQKQTGVSHVRFLQEAGAGSSAIEGLKSWLGRQAKVEWPANSEDVIGAKRAVMNAQWMKLVELGAVRPVVPHFPLSDLQMYAFRVARVDDFGNFEPRHYDDVQAALGRKLRLAIEGKHPGQPGAGR